MDRIDSYGSAKSHKGKSGSSIVVKGKSKNLIWTNPGTIIEIFIYTCSLKYKVCKYKRYVFIWLYFYMKQVKNILESSMDMFHVYTAVLNGVCLGREIHEQRHGRLVTVFIYNKFSSEIHGLKHGCVSDRVSIVILVQRTKWGDTHLYSSCF